MISGAPIAYCCLEIGSPDGRIARRRVDAGGAAPAIDEDKDSTYEA